MPRPRLEIKKSVSQQSLDYRIFKEITSVDRFLKLIQVLVKIKNVPMSLKLTEEITQHLKEAKDSKRQLNIFVT